jgi:hypothetical protein
VEADDTQSGRDRIGAQPSQAELVAGSEQNDGRSGSRDVGEFESELNGRMDGLTGLDAGGKISTCNEI